MAKALKQHLLIGGGDAFTAILHANHQVIVLMVIQTDAHHHPATIGEFNGITDDIGQHLLKAQRVAIHPHRHIIIK